MTEQRRLQFLFLGGTGYIGPYHVREALAAGHRVAVFNRGKTAPGALPEGVEQIIGDRDGELDGIANRDWDVVVDLATYVPGRVRSLGAALKGRVGLYVFMSTMMVYDEKAEAGALTEASPVHEYHGKDDPFGLAQPAHYGAFKILCEREAERLFPGRTLVLRLGHIVGPADWHGGFTYWPARIAHGGDVVVAGEADTPVQVIDVRDIARFTIGMCERDRIGIYNVTGALGALRLRELVDAAREESGGSARAHYLPPAFVEAHGGAEQWAMLLFWTAGPGGYAAHMRMDTARACAAGLKLRSLQETLRDTRTWYEGLSAERRNALVTMWGRNADGARIAIPRPWEAYLAEESQLLDSWRASAGGMSVSNVLRAVSWH